MKTIHIILTVIISFLQPLNAQTKTDAKTIDLYIKIDNYNPTKGKVHIAIYKSSEDFYQKKRIKIKPEVQSKGLYLIKGLAKGTYAILLVQDTNGNGKLDFDNYIPTEPFGVSNNPQLMGPPAWEDAAFDLQKNSVIPIQLITYD